ncbi:MAG TPA: HAD-IA family hydrolase [Anaeromyxobacteraceae bacterium]|nr:HAD-IA family hydrolase [Anaeromyxobacteraceae bacterium]
MRLDHVGLEVEDLFTEELFYRRALGFLPRYRYVSRTTPGLRTVFLERDGVALELLERPRGEGFRAGRGEAPGHLSLAVEDVDGWYERLRALAFPGVRLLPPRDTGDGYRELTLHDPEGHVVELAARVAPPPRLPLRAVLFDLDGTLVDGGAPGGARAFPEMRRFLGLVRQGGLPVAVATGASRGVLARLLAETGLDAELPVAVSAEEVARGKPWPDVFLEAARRLGVAPEACLVVEDSAPGVEAARRAFMRCLAVPSAPERPLPDAFLMADLLVEPGMGAFDAGAAWAWVEPRRDG